MTSVPQVTAKKTWNEWWSEDVWVSFANVVCKRWHYYAGWALGFVMAAVGLWLDAMGFVPY
jgi:hypothetical protein